MVDNGAATPGSVTSFTLPKVKGLMKERLLHHLVGKPVTEHISRLLMLRRRDPLFLDLLAVEVGDCG